MHTARHILQPWVIAALIGWPVLVLLAQTFKGATVGGPLCRADPTCAETGYLPPLVWLGGMALILVLGWVARRRAA
jgi:hypothetical protein